MSTTSSPLVLNYMTPLLLIRRTSPNSMLIKECYCCRRSNILGQQLYSVSRLLRQSISSCRHCKHQCDHRKNKCSRTNKIKKINLIGAVITKMNRMPSNMKIIYRPKN